MLKCKCLYSIYTTIYPQDKTKNASGQRRALEVMQESSSKTNNADSLPPCWGVLKHYMARNCDFSLENFRNNLPILVFYRQSRLLTRAAQLPGILTIRAAQKA